MICVRFHSRGQYAAKVSGDPRRAELAGAKLLRGLPSPVTRFRHSRSPTGCPIPQVNSIGNAVDLGDWAAKKLPYTQLVIRGVGCTTVVRCLFHWPASP